MRLTKMRMVRMRKRKAMTSLFLSVDVFKRMCQRTLMKVFRDIASGTDQVFYSTQSSLFVDIAHFDDIILLDAFQGFDVVWDTW